MAGRHQVFSSNKKTRQKAQRSWRRKAKQHPEAVPLDAGQLVLNLKVKKGDHKSLKERIRVKRNNFGTPLGPLLEQALKQT